ncbi:spermidine/putrescine ABC transporter permease PotB [Moritella sp. 5]|uniref:spermidine/putrescine ABC transporter permease PotB n=1 Tax=Moritella sp. 5 TaxID=2746231 RepID=UPI001BA831DD|nr:spermidine/putrescine ABC transporter permease PotB [Moritella sp. 5]QUM80754.1 spermidine/putrescine ABC transporter permease PotB [Moritella sp. 5]
MINSSLFKRFSIGLLLVWLSVFVLVPNLMIIVTSFLTRDDANLISLTFTLDNYVRLFDPLYFKVLSHSVYMASIATFVCLIIGYPFAYTIALLPKKVRPVLLFLIIVPFWTNSLIRTYGIKILLAKKGLLNALLLNLHIIDKPLKLMYTEFAVIFALVYILLPFMILPLYSSIEKIDKSLIEAAKDLGASKFTTFLKVELPLTMPGIIAGMLLVFLPAMGMFYIADLVGGAKNLLIGNTIKTQFLNIRDWPFGSAASITLTVFMAGLLFFYYKVGKSIKNRGNNA